jgi:hypothetical protein
LSGRPTLLQLPSFPIFLAAVPTLFIAANNPGEAALVDVVATAFVCIAFAAAIYAVVLLALRRRARPEVVALVALLAIAWVFLVPMVADELSRTWLVLARLRRMRVFLPLAGAIFAAATVWLLRHNRDRTAEARGAAIGTYLLLLISGTQVLVSGVRRAGSAKDGGTVSRLAQAPIPLRPARPARDIYLIILDAYSNGPTLRDVHGFSNASFEDSLKSLGFVVPETRSNYGHTIYSLASLLNFAHFDASEPIPDKGPLHTAIERSRAVRSLRRIGYSYWLFPSRAFRGTQRSELADSTYVPEGINRWRVAAARSPLSSEVWNSTSLGLLVTRFGYGISIPELDLHSLRDVAASSSIARPKFVFAHIMLTHHPFYFDSACRHTLGLVTAERWRKEAYLNQVQCTNKHLIKAVTVLRRLRPEPIILLQGDHGSAIQRAGARGVGVTRAEVQEQIGAFGAYYMPGLTAEAIGDTVTPVNLFRIIFREYFGAGLDDLPNHSFLNTPAPNAYFRRIDFAALPATRAGQN